MISFAHYGCESYDSEKAVIAAVSCSAAVEFYA